MIFNPDISEQAVEIVFSVTNIKPEHPELIFSGIAVASESSSKHLMVDLDERLSFSKHIIKETLIYLINFALGH